MARKTPTAVRTEATKGVHRATKKVVSNKTKPRPKRIRKDRLPESSMDELAEEIDLPECPKHAGTSMQFNPETFLWHCTLMSCDVTVMSRKDAERGDPLVGTGDIELVVLVEDPEDPPAYFIRATGNNVLINITDMMNPGALKIKAGQNGQQMMIANLVFQHVNKINSNGVTTAEGDGSVVSGY